MWKRATPVTLRPLMPCWGCWFSPNKAKCRLLLFWCLMSKLWNDLTQDVYPGKYLTTWLHKGLGENTFLSVSLCSQIKLVFQSNLHSFCSWAFRYVFGDWVIFNVYQLFSQQVISLTARVQEWIHFVMVYSMFLRKQVECIFLFSSQLFVLLFLNQGKDVVVLIV